MGRSDRQIRRGHINLAALLGLITTLAVAVGVSGFGYRHFGVLGGVVGMIVGIVVGVLAGALVLASVQGLFDLVPMRSSPPARGEVIVGGLYAMPSEKRKGFSILKVLAFEDGVVHVRMYANAFPAIPERIDPRELNLGSITIEAIDSKTLGPIGVGHMPFSTALFFRGRPTLIQTEPVVEDELESVREWKAAGGGVIG